MNSPTTWIAVAMLFAGHLASQTPAVRVWAVSDGVRVNPVTGQVFEQRTDIHKDYPAGDFRQNNLVWNAATSINRAKSRPGRTGIMI